MANSDARLLCDVLVGDEDVVGVVGVVDPDGLGVELVLDVAILLCVEVGVVVDCRVRLVTSVVDITIRGGNKKGYTLCK